MAITSAVCNSFKVEVLQALHNFTASTGNDFKLALYTSSATLNKSTTAYTTSNEMTNTSGSAYTAGGIALTSVTPALSTDTACCDFANVSFSSASFTANGCLIYNDTNSDRAVCAIAFGGDKTVTNGTFTIEFPAADASNAILRIA
jgi:poly-gamma-glutamate capsule biosynthesis protein CapA/YwtB (metallophosphatase superfamily)